MATAASKVMNDNPTATGGQSLTAAGGKDVVESTLRTMDESTKGAALSEFVDLVADDEEALERLLALALGTRRARRP